MKKNIEDIVDYMIKIDKTEKSQVFFMPWDYVIKPFSSDSNVRAELIEKELGTEIDLKIDSLKQEMMMKNQAMMELIHSKFNEVIQHVSAAPSKAVMTPSYASVVGHGQQVGVVPGGAQVEQGGGNVGQVSMPGSIPSFRLTAPTPPSWDRSTWGQSAGNRGGGHSDEHRQDGGGLARSRSGSSSKRRRGENGAIEDDSRDRSNSNSNSNNRQKKFVVGTASQPGRKMRSPPADIFVYGVHPDTTVEDIVQDLAYSDIVITNSDIIQKSKEEAFLKSYKISVKAEDLQKALDPAIWPLRVKVREFIHYSRRSAVQRNSSGVRPQQGAGARHGQHEGGHGQTHGQVSHPAVGDQGGDLRGQSSQFLAPNRYAMPGDGTPGGGMSV